MSRKPLHFFLAASLVTVVAAATAQKPAVKSPRLYVFDCGRLDNDDVSRYRLKKEEVATTTMSVACFLVVHPKGTLMWDVGAVPDKNFQPGAAKATERYATTFKPLKAQLADVGYSPGEITYLALSHFHWDHVANSDQFAGSTWLVRSVERDQMFTDKPSERTAPAYYQKLRNSKTVFIKDNDYDVFGDGTVVIKFTPGHTPGHQSLYVNLARTGPVVLTGDLYHYPEERTLNRLPTFDVDEKQTAASRAALEEFLKKNHAQLWIQHDFTAFGKLKKAPAYYD